MGKFLYELDSKEKFDCPSCEQNSCFVKYRNTSTGRYLEGDYGRCDRENHCGYHKRPENNKIINNKLDIEEEYLSIHDCDFIPDGFYETMRKNTYKAENVLLRQLVKMFGKKRVLEIFNKYKLGTWHDGATTFPYISYGLHTAKIIWYGNDLHRIKEGRGSYPQWLHNCRYKDKNDQVHTIEFEGRRPIPFFGHHLLMEDFDKENTFICIVEAEKTAIIMSILYPQYIWIATGGLRNLTKRKFTFFQRTKILVFADMGIIKVENISVRDLWYQKITEAALIVDIRYAFVNYIPYFMPTIMKENWEDQGKDVLDFMFDFKPDWMNDGYNNYMEYLNVMIEEAKKRI